MTQKIAVRVSAMSEIQVIDREKKANFDIRITNKETNKSKMLSIYAENQTEETLRDKIKSKLENEEEFMCSIDGNALSVVKPDFENLAVSPAVFIDLTEQQIEQLQQLKNKEAE